MECFSEIQFCKNGNYDLADVLQVTEIITTYNIVNVPLMKLRISVLFLKRFAHPSIYVNLIPQFRRPVHELYTISNYIQDRIYDNFVHLHSFNQSWFAPDQLEYFKHKIHEKGALLDFCMGFIDRTVRPISRPSSGQRILYTFTIKFL